MLNDSYISKNTFEDHMVSVYFVESFNNIVSENNFFNCSRAHGRFIQASTTWEHNFWDRPRVLPYPIIGLRILTFIKDFFIPYPWINFDWHPALKPYNIDEGEV